MGTLTAKTAVVTGSTSGNRIGLLRAPSPAPAPMWSSTAWGVPGRYREGTFRHRERFHNGQGRLFTG